MLIISKSHTMLSRMSAVKGEPYQSVEANRRYQVTPEPDILYKRNLRTSHTSRPFSATISIG